MKTAKTQKSKKSVTMDPELESSLRKVQARLLEKTDTSWSLSKVLNIALTVGLSSGKRLSKEQWQAAKAQIDDKNIVIEAGSLAAIVEKLS